MKVEIQEKHQVLMVNKTISFKKKGQRKKGNFKKNGKQVAAQVKNPSLDLSLKLSASTAKDWSLEAELSQVIGG